ncbi:hypothetical protein [Arcticibacter eurypsychrophilus]|uniref:hypothetical protein n=1 Tax=Arcticibacter eurypsychrophilus TaxID=1434752 RepID=UPI00084D3B3B|nr:hypothetical protein [Arcticibacter eurypsychrophilus]
MKLLRYLTVLICFMSLFLVSNKSYSQCSMCAATADNSTQNGNTEGNGLNDGILYLLAAPYLAVAGIGFLWYKKYRKDHNNLDPNNENFNR